MKRPISMLLSLVLIICMMILSPISASAAKAQVNKEIGFSSVSQDKGINSTLADISLTPSITSLSCEKSGVKLTYREVPNATKYRIFVKTDRLAKWKKLTDTTMLEAIDVKVKNNKEYTYTVRALDKDGKYCSDYDKLGVTIRYYATPSVLAISTKKSITLKWDKLKGVENYRVFYKENDSKWKRLVDTDKTKYLFKDIKKDVEYSFSVRSLNKDKTNYLCGFDEIGTKTKHLSAPVITSCTPADKGVEIKWTKIQEAELYRVYYKGKNSWKIVGDTTTNSFTHQGLKNGSKYTYTVRCLTKDLKAYTSGFDTTGYTYTYYDAPTLKVAEDVKSGPKISWNKVPGASMYRVYYSVDKGPWKTDDTMITKDNSFILKNAETNHKYTFTVRCLDDKKKAISFFNLKGKSVKYLEMPKILKATYDNGVVDLAWTSVEGANNYRVFYRESSQDGWTTLDNVSSTQYQYYTEISGFTCQYAVRCISDDLSVYESAFENGPVVTSYLVGTDKPDYNYQTARITLCDQDRKDAEHIVMGEAGSMGFTGCALVAQALKDAYVYGGYSHIMDVIKGFHYDGSMNVEPNADAINAVRYIFDDGGAAVQHRILIFYAYDLCNSSYHESQNYICTCQNVRFFDFY